MRKRIRAFRWWAAFAAGASACGAAGSSELAPVHDATRSEVLADRGHVAVPPGALSFVRTEPVTSGGASAVVEAPARVTFRDGAVSRVGAPVPGRVQEVHVRLGDHVTAGTPLVTLGSPDAAGARAELRRAKAVLHAS